MYTTAENMNNNIKNSFHEAVCCTHPLQNESKDADDKIKPQKTNFLTYDFA